MTFALPLMHNRFQMKNQYDIFQIKNKGGGYDEIKAKSAKYGRMFSFICSKDFRWNMLLLGASSTQDAGQVVKVVFIS